jgi:hypothetical protein
MFQKSIEIKKDEKYNIDYIVLYVGSDFNWLFSSEYSQL